MSAVMEKTVKEVELRGEIVGRNKAKGTAEIKLGNGDFVSFKVPNEVAEEIIEDSYSHYTPSLFRRNYLVLLVGRAICDEGGRLFEFTPEIVKKLNPLDPIYRMEQLSALEDNWNQEGEPALHKEGMEWLTKFFRQYPPNLRPPYLYPWEENIISVEWQQKNSPLCLHMDLDIDTHILNGVIFYSDSSKPTKEVTYNLDNDSDVESLHRVVEEFGGAFLNE